MEYYCKSSIYLRPVWISKIIIGRWVTDQPSQNKNKNITPPNKLKTQLGNTIVFINFLLRQSIL